VPADGEASLKRENRRGGFLFRGLGIFPNERYLLQQIHCLPHFET